MPDSGHVIANVDGNRDDEKVKRDLIKLVFGMTPIVLATHLITGTLVASVYYDVEPVSLVTTWWLLIGLLVAVGSIIWLWYRQHGGPSHRWTRFAIVGSAASGVLWGIAGFLFYSSANVTQSMVLVFVMGGMGAGAVSALTPCLPAFFAYLLPSTLSFCLRLALEGDTHHWIMATTLGCYVVSLCLLGRKANRWLTELASRRISNEDLFRSIENPVNERTDASKTVDQRLHRDIAEPTPAEKVLANYADRQMAIADLGRAALSGIDLSLLFDNAVAMVRDRLAVSGAAVIETSAHNSEQILRASAGLDSYVLATETGKDCADLQPCSPRGDTPNPTKSLLRLVPKHFAETDGRFDSAKATISNRNDQFGVLVAVAEVPRHFSTSDMGFLRAVANTLMSAIERKRVEQDIEHKALHDALTGLPNRDLFRSKLYKELVRLKRTQGMLALLLLNLDHFKHINDTLGYPIGDRLLQMFACRLKDCVHEVDAPARLGGDEFAIILSDLGSPEEAAGVARKIVDRVSEPFVLDGNKTQAGASVGIAISPHDGDDVDDLLRNADLALYRAKVEERNSYRFCSTDKIAQIENQKDLEHDLTHALKRKELFLEYQPQFDLSSMRLVGGEALVRWRHPTRGLLVPDLFIPVAEMTGLIDPLSRWVLNRVAENMRAMTGAGPTPIFISTNISLSQCRAGHLVETVKKVAERGAFGFDRLEFEIKEHLSLTSGDGIDTLRRLRKLGVTISIDDFGTGHSSFSRLINLPIDKIKIDRTLVGRLGKGHNAEMLIRAIIALAKSQGMRVTAEGIETERQLAFLTAEGCTFGQGHYLGSPLSPEAFTMLLRSEFASSSIDSGNVIH